MINQTFALWEAVHDTHYLESVKSFSKGERLRCLSGYFSVPRGQTNTICHLGEQNLFHLKLWAEDDGLFWCCLSPPHNCTSVIFILLRGFILQRSQCRYHRVSLQVCVQLAIDCISVRKKTMEFSSVRRKTVEFPSCVTLCYFLSCYTIFWVHTRYLTLRYTTIFAEGKNTENLDW